MSEEATLQRNIRSRAGHRASASKQITKAEEELYATTGGPDSQRLRQLKQTLQQKLGTLQALNDAILEKVDEDQLEEEIDQIDTINSKIELCIISIEDALKVREDIPSSKVSHPTPIETAPRSTIRTSTDTSHTTESDDHTPAARLGAAESTFTAGGGIHAPRVKLPKLSIRRFNGDVKQWLPFWNQFRSAIHNNPTLNDVDKFNYLQSYLEDEAADAIEGMALTEANYTEAIDRLQARFGDTSWIVGQHIQSLMNLPSITDCQDLPAVRKLLDKVQTTVASLKALGEPEESYGRIATSALMTRLPTEIKISATKELGAHTQHAARLIAAINQEVTARERLAMMEGQHQQHERSLIPPRKNPPSAAAFLAHNSSPGSCPFCGEDHRPEACTKIPTSSARATILKKQGRCFNCLKKNHMSRDCRSKDRCKKCRAKHHTAICRDEGAKKQTPTPNQGHGGGKQPKPTPTGEVIPSGKDAVPTLSLLTGADSTVLLQTARMKLFNPQAKPRRHREVRAILDTGSQNTYILEEVARRLQLPQVGEEKLKVQTFGEKQEAPMTFPVVKLAIQTQHGGPIKVDALVVPYVCDTIHNQPTEEARNNHHHLKNLHLSDPHKGEDELDVEFLVGSDVYWKLVTGQTRRGRDGPTAIKTRVGWVLSGPTESSSDNTTANLLVKTTHVLRIHTTPVEDRMDQQLKKFWELESLGIHQDEGSVQDTFNQTISFREGRYQVELPWKPHHRPLPTNLELCRKRLTNLLKKLKSTPEILHEYNRVIQEQLQKGIVEEVPDGSRGDDSKVHYLPHHAVVRKDKATTKVRVVYDASAKSMDNPCLNDCLYAGPSFDQSIMDILLRFRLHPIGLIADIEKAFLMIGVEPTDRDALRFLWTKNAQDPEAPLQHLRFTRVTFGVNSSPFLLNATVQHHLHKYLQDDPHFVKTLLSSIYVDDLTFGAANDEEAYQLYTKSKIRLAEGGFNLRKFTSNSTSLQRLIDSQEGKTKTTPTTAEEDMSFAQSTLGAKGEDGEKGEEEVKVLGVRWNHGSDKLVFGMGEMVRQMEGETPTKREVVGAAARVFDPLGVLAPSTILWKMLFQDTCKADIGWDEELQGDCLREWRRLDAAMREEVTFTLPRCYGHNHIGEARLVGFCDASERGYAAVVYLRVGGGEEATVNFIAAKTRVAPTKKTTIPRLELLSALLLSKLAHSVEEALKEAIKLEETRCYTDSKVALCWIQGQDKEWRQFVNNRVNTIRQLQPSQRWQHCPGVHNPADIPSRGMLPRELREREMWLHGPDWLKRSLKPPSTGAEQLDTTEECLKEARKRHTLTTLTGEKKGVGQIINIQKFSSLKRLLGVTTAVFKFASLLKKERKEPSELQQEARVAWLREAQEEVQTSKKFLTLKKQLNLQQDNQGLWRCVGRLDNSQAEGRRPILIGRDHQYTQLLLIDAHERVLHGGVRATLTELRSHYWIPRGRQLVRKKIHRCLICRRHEGPPFRSLPAPQLPTFRVQPDRPFSSTGVDFAGPLYVKSAEGGIKTWVCLYTCCSSRAVHLEVVPGLDTEAFLRCFRRFCGRRGVPERIVSDNAKTFLAADRELKALMEAPELQDHFQKLSITWKYITEKAPWQGGVFERMVKSFKRCVRKTVGSRSLTLDELNTLVIEIEAVLNSRPLAYLSEEDTEEFLTPSHLITGHRILSLPDPVERDDAEEPEYLPDTERLTRRMSHLTTLKKRFWKKWKLEYLQELREHHRSLNTAPGVAREIQENEPVLIYDEDQPRGLWRLGRIDELVRSTDGSTRAAKVRVTTGTGRITTLKRPIQHLYPLEIREPAIKNKQPEETSIEDTTAEVIGNPTIDDSTPGEPSGDHPPTRPTRQAAEKARAQVHQLAAQGLV